MGHVKSNSAILHSRQWYRGFNFSASSLIPVTACPHHLCHPVECDMVSDYGFSLPLSVTNNSKNIFMFSAATCSFSLERYLKLFAHFQSGLFIFLLLQEFFLCFRYVSCQMCGLQTFVSNSMGSLFTSLTLFLEAQKLFCVSSPIYPKPGSTL